MSKRDQTDRVDALLAACQDDSSEVGLVLRRALERVKAGANMDEAWGLTLAERLTTTRREHWSRELLELTADVLLEEYEPKLKTEWKRSPEHDWEQINRFAKWLKARGVPACRTEAEKIVADIQGVTVHALRQRRYRRPRRPKL